jgi:5-methylcytosine-specific restriction endonuclease McrA
MNEFSAIVARHPIDKKPYNAIRLCRVDHFGTPIYRVARDDRESGAPRALKIAFELYGAHCYHCGVWMPAQPLSTECTRDHVRAKANDGSDYLHNLVFACGTCNSKKGKADLISFNVERGADYLRSLEAHLVRCIKALPRMESATEPSRDGSRSGSSATPGR